MTRPSKHKVILQVLDLDPSTGVMDVEVCVQSEACVGVYRTTLMITAPRSLVKAVRQATEDLEEQHRLTGICLDCAD